MADHEEDLFEVFDDRDDADDTGAEPEVVGSPKLFLDTLRSHEARLRALDVRPGDVFIGYAGDRLWVSVGLVDDTADVEYGCVRVDVTEHDWRGAWVSPSLADAHELSDAAPREPTASGPMDEPEQGAQAAVAWLSQQLSEPVLHYVWQRDGVVVAELWQVESTGHSLIASGDPAERSDPNAAEAIRVR